MSCPSPSVALLLVPLLVLLSLLPPPVASLNVFDLSWNKDEVKKQIYTDIKPVYSCFKLLTVDGQHGCESQSSAATQ